MYQSCMGRIFLNAPKHECSLHATSLFILLLHFSFIPFTFLLYLDCKFTLFLISTITNNQTSQSNLPCYLLLQR